MSLTVEDGTGLSNAESYISAADAGTYHSNRGNTTWASLSDAVKEQCLRKATDYMVAMYRGQWQGDRISSDQSLDFPRSGVVVDNVDIDSDSVPDKIKNACAELALKANSDDLFEDQDQAMISLGVGSLNIAYDKASPQRKRYMLVEAMIAPFLINRSSINVSLTRC